MSEFSKFDLYFAGLVSIQYHPSNPREKRMTLDEIAEVARECVLISLEEEQCPGD